MNNSYFTSRLAPFIFLALLTITTTDLYGQRFSRDYNVGLLINQAGYVPGAGKAIVSKGKLAGKFELVNLETGSVVYSGNFISKTDDFGLHSSADFSGFTGEGFYYVRTDTMRSYPFRISKDVYHAPVELIVGYFSLQRCGSSTTGYLSPCHVDDGIRMDNGKHQDVSGGWHDASDLRKWVGATIYGMIGLAKTYELLDENNTLRPKILDELLWGNRYFLNMQEPEGYVMNYVGGDVKKHSDSNRWTNNEIGKEGGELKFVKPSAGKSMNDMLLFGTNDDRVIRTDPVDSISQYNFITSQAIMARITRASDPQYSDKCLDAAVRCYDWCQKTIKDTDAGILGAGIQAATEMYKTTKSNTYRDFAVEQATQLRKLQVKKPEGGISGFYLTSLTNNEPYKDIWHGCLEFISICDLIRTFPSHNDVDAWKDMVSNYATGYLLPMSKKNSFGIVPFGLYSTKDPAGNRKIGKYWYRYFMQPELAWWVGINSNVASAGIGLVKIADILKDEKLRSVAQKQLDWIIGVNPFNSSTLIGVGYNHPKHFGGSSFSPKTPVLPGAVLNGLGGDKADQPVIGTGNWQISEYWTPMVAYTLWLMAEISKTEKN